MRINLSHVNSHLIQELKISQAISAIRHDGGDIVFVDLPSGDFVAIHLVERDIDVGEIKNILDRNAAMNAYTLFILSAPMLLPDDGALYSPYDWMTALLDIYGDKIYGYESYGGAQVYIFPVNFAQPLNGIRRQVKWGEIVDMANLGCDVVHVEGGVLNGTWRIADFDGYDARQTRHSMPTQEPVPGTIGAYYAALGIVYGADAEEVRKAYRQLAREFHPDLNKTPEATARMQQINTAYEMIMQQLGEESER